MLLGRFYKTWISFEPQKKYHWFRIANTWRTTDGKLRSVEFESSDFNSMENIHKLMSPACGREQIEVE